MHECQNLLTLQNTLAWLQIFKTGTVAFTDWHVAMYPACRWCAAPQTTHSQRQNTVDNSRSLTNSGCKQ
eukprot:6467668-Amphidinium_carterae.5